VGKPRYKFIAVPYPALMLDVDSSQEGESSICVFTVTVYILATKPGESKNILLQIPCV